MFPWSNREERPTLLIGTIKVAAAIGVLSVLAANFLSDGAFDQGRLARLAAAAVNEPQMTGSITKAASQTRLDPCAVKPRG